MEGEILSLETAEKLADYEKLKKDYKLLYQSYLKEQNEKGEREMKERVLSYIKDFGSITTYNAFIDLGCTRLSEYIRQLREDYNIQDEWVHTVNRYGEKVQYKRYWLEEN